MTIGNFLNNLRDSVVRAKNAGLNWGKDAVNSIGAAPDAVAPESGSVSEAIAQQQAKVASPGPSIKMQGPAGPNSWTTPHDMPNLVKPAYTAGENYNFNGAQAGQPQPTVQSKPGFLRRTAGGLLKGGLAAGAIAGSYDAIKNGTTNMDDQIALEMEHGVGNQDVGTPERQNARRAFGASMVNVTRRIGDALVPDFIMPQAGTRAVGGLRDIIRGDPLGTTVERFKGDLQPPAPPSTPIAQQQAQPAAAQPSGPSIFDSKERDSYGMPPLPKNATPEQAKQWLDASNEMVKLKNSQRGAVQGQQSGDETAPLRDLINLDKGAKPGHSGFGSMAALGGLGALERMKSNQANLNLREQQIRTQADTARNQAMMQYLEHQRQQQNFERTTGNAEDATRREMRKKLNSERALLIEGDAKPSTLGMGGETPDQYKARLTKREAEIETLMQNSAADVKGGKGLDEMNPTQIHQLHQAYDTKQKVEAGREGFQQKLADYAGTKRFDSKNLYGYIPASVEPTSAIGDTWRVKMANGNTITLTNLAGGGFNVLSPNQPVNADLMAQVTPLIERYKKTGK